MTKRLNSARCLDGHFANVGPKAVSYCGHGFVIEKRTFATQGPGDEHCSWRETEELCAAEERDGGYPYFAGCGTKRKQSIEGGRVHKNSVLT